MQETTFISLVTTSIGKTEYITLYINSYQYPEITLCIKIIVMIIVLYPNRLNVLVPNVWGYV